MSFSHFINIGTWKGSPMSFYKLQYLWLSANSHFYIFGYKLIIFLKTKKTKRKTKKKKEMSNRINLMIKLQEEKWIIRMMKTLKWVVQDLPLSLLKNKKPFISYHRPIRITFCLFKQTRFLILWRKMKF